MTSICAAAILTAGAQQLSGSWQGSLDMGGTKLRTVINITDGKCTVDSPDQGAYGIEARTEHISADSLCISIPATSASYAGGLHGGTLKGTFRQMGMAFPLDMKKVEIVRNRPQTPQPPLPYPTEEVTFENSEAGAVLSGTLSYPAGWSGKEKTPVVLMVTGSGPQDRDEEMCGGHKPFFVIADYLARNGIATLRYDDRGTGKSTGDHKNATTDDFMADAAAGIRYLKTTGKFGTVGVLGHSEGGSIAFMLAARGVTDFIVSMAGPGVRGDSIIAEQTRRMTNKPNVTTDMIRTAAKMQNNPWMNRFIDYSPAADIAAVRCPVLDVNGGKDIQVDADINLGAIRRLLSGNARTTIKEYPDMNHLFQHCTTGAVSEYGEIEETVAPEVLEDITRWIKDIKPQPL